MKPASHRLALLAQFSPLLIPAIVFPLVLSVAEERFWWSVGLVMVSFAAAAGRLFVVQKQLLVSSREVEKNLALLKGITEGTPDAIFVKDLQGRYLMINSAGARFVGRPRRRFIGKDDIELFSPDTGRAIMERDRKVLEAGVTQTYEEAGDCRGCAPDFTFRPRDLIAIRAARLLDCWESAAISPTANAPKRRCASRSRNCASTSNTLLWPSVEWDLDFRVTAWNPSAERIFGYSCDRKPSDSTPVLSCPPQFRQHVDQVWQSLLKQSGGARSTNDNRHQGRTHHLLRVV